MVTARLPEHSAECSGGRTCPMEVCHENSGRSSDRWGERMSIEERIENALENNEGMFRLIEAIGVDTAVEAVATEAANRYFRAETEQNVKDGCWRAMLIHHCGDEDCELNIKTAFIFDEQEEAQEYADYLFNSRRDQMIKDGKELFNRRR